MTIRLTVDETAWRRHVRSIAASVDHLVPVVKGNGYGFGRARLAAEAAALSDVLAVGTVHELDALPVTVDAVVLTPTLDPRPVADRDRTILTVGSLDHVAALGGEPWRVVVKLESSMRRYGGSTELIRAARAAGARIEGVAIHPPLVGDDAAHVADITTRIDGVDPTLPLWVSHLSPDALRTLPAGREYWLRLGTALWHGDKSMLHLSADVLQVRPVRAGEQAGYRATRIDADGTLVMIGAGSANGVQPLPDGRSPFHFAQRRLTLVEPPHMHTSMVFVGTGEPCPRVGDVVDVQRPLITTAVDEVVWR